jgi:trimeric autotransporter adhesin
MGILIILASIFWGVSLSAQAASSAVISYSTSKSTIRVGDSFDIKVNISGVSNLYAASIDFKYDPTLFKITGISKGSIFSTVSSVTPVNKNSTSSGLFSYACTLQGASTGLSSTSTKTLFVIHATALKSGSVNLKTISANTSLSNTGNNVRIKLVDSTKDSKPIGYTAAVKSIEIDEALLYTLKAGKYEENNAAFSYVGSWKKDSHTSYSGGSVFYSTTPGNYITFKFTGTGFRWFSPANPKRGIAKITIDGTPYTKDTYNATQVYSKNVFEKIGLTYGTHTVKIEVTSSKSSLAQTYTQAIDYIEILNEPPVLTAGKYEESNAAFTYAGSWKKDSHTSYSGGSVFYSTTPGNYITFKFTGTGFRWFSPANPKRGIAKITIDGTPYTKDTYNATQVYSKNVFEKIGLTYGTHTVKIEVTSSKSSLAQTYTQAIDYIEILNEPPVLTAGKYEESNAAFTYAGSWKKDSHTSYSGGSVFYSTTPGNYITFKFTGTGFRWFSPANPKRGIAKITIDGTPYTKDTYNATQVYSKNVFEKIGLTYGTHTVKIEVTSSKSSLAQTYTQAIDYIEILY